jgi:L-ascorbate metabolism protein UlaG (beta-lactamase superfamily)
MPDLTWWGHSTCTIEKRGVRILTDPLFCLRLGHLRRRRGPLPGAWSRRADLAVVSHLHVDHLHVGSVALLPLHVPVVLPRGALRAVPELRRLRNRELVEVSPVTPSLWGGLSSKPRPPITTAAGGRGRGDGRRPSGTW